MTLSEAKEAGRLAEALGDLEHDRKALRDYGKRSSGVVEMSFWDDENTAIATGTMIPIETAIRIIDDVASTITKRLQQLGVEP